MSSTSILYNEYFWNKELICEMSGPNDGGFTSINPIKQYGKYTINHRWDRGSGWWAINTGIPWK